MKALEIARIAWKGVREFQRVSRLPVWVSWEGMPAAQKLQSADDVLRAIDDPEATRYALEKDSTVDKLFMGLARTVHALHSADDSKMGTSADPAFGPQQQQNDADNHKRC